MPAASADGPTSGRTRHCRVRALRPRCWPPDRRWRGSRPRTRARRPAVDERCEPAVDLGRSAVHGRSQRCPDSRSGVGCAIAFRKARVDFAFSARKYVSPRAVLRTRAGRTAFRRRVGDRAGQQIQRAAHGSTRRQHLDAGVGQHRGQPDQGQADQGGWIARLDARHKRDAERFDLRRTGAVVRLVEAQVTFERRAGQACASERSSERCRPAAPRVAGRRRPAPYER